jgi:hypothetical protein
LEVLPEVAAKVDVFEIIDAGGEGGGYTNSASDYAKWLCHIEDIKSGQQVIKKIEAVTMIRS